MFFLGVIPMGLEVFQTTELQYKKGQENQGSFGGGDNQLTELLELKNGEDEDVVWFFC